MGSEPTEFYPDGTKFWIVDGQLHREDGPAVIRMNGTQEWWLNGKLHREDGPAYISPLGTQIWYKHDKFHREDGPALIRENGETEWYFENKRHRLDGPAITTYWYIHDNDVTIEITKWAKERDIDLNNLTEEDKMAIKFEWGQRI